VVAREAEGQIGYWLHVAWSAYPPPPNKTRGPQQSLLPCC